MSRSSKINDVDVAYANYFGVDESYNANISETKSDVLVGVNTDEVYDVDVNESNITNIDDLGNMLKKILNVAWGEDWGEIAPEFSGSEDISNATLPKIVYDINYRETPDKMSKKPTLFRNVSEKVDGKPTGDSFNIYRQWFDTVVEFNFYGKTMLEARTLMNNFEELINTYTGLIKKNGLSELMFLKEVPSENSVKYINGVPMKTLMYYARFEKIYTVRTSLLNKLDYEINVKNG